MSWQDKVTKQLQITCGDGRVFTVIWINASQSIEWQGSEFNFLEINGTYAKKKKLLGRKFPLEFYFQGEDHLDEFALFAKSCGDPNPCVIDHPLYGLITAQIFSLNVDDTTMNYSKVTATAIETITDANPQTTLDPLDQMAQKSAFLITQQPWGNVPFIISDENIITLNNNQCYKKGIKIITIPDEASDYLNAFSTASNYVASLVASPTLALQATMSFLTLPGKFTADVQSRVNMLQAQFLELRNILINPLTPSIKQIYQVQSVSLVSAMCYAAATPLTGNYTNSTSAINIIDVISVNYQQLLADLDLLQDPNGANPNYFIPDFQFVNTLNEIVNLTISSLVQIALNGRQERSLILTEDTNIVVLCHRLYSLDPYDNNLDELINNNHFNYHDMLGLDKGRKITYYI